MQVEEEVASAAAMSEATGAGDAATQSALQQPLSTPVAETQPQQPKSGFKKLFRFF
jgi:hypothetical protein